jgi:hypothetical protein
MALRFSLALLALTLFLSQAVAASDGGTPWFQETIAFKGAAIFAFIDSDIKYDGRRLDLEDDLDLDDFSALPSSKPATSRSCARTRGRSISISSSRTTPSFRSA